ncbi:MAG: ATP-binding cassette domain-containing protein [Acidimicrobiia bacterium]|nr:ATP-binding cassette domain-containing protein [Acidimicrobiia bacterium]MYF82722.1 ATP-binding cassette domain-containing protein [Acidimicrobiia bacterium]
MPWTLEDLDQSIEAGSAGDAVGESGSGQSTLVRVLCGLLIHQEGDVKSDGRELGTGSRTTRGSFVGGTRSCSRVPGGPSIHA